VSVEPVLLGFTAGTSGRLIGGGPALLAALAPAAQLDQAVLARHLLALPSETLQLVGVGIVELVLGEIVLLALLWRSREAGLTGQARRREGARRRRRYQ
jgi:hypothetical protein